MNKKLITLMALAVAQVTSVALAQDPKTNAAIETKVAMCVGCHGIVGYQATFPEIYKVPMISGQSEKYMVEALTAYKKGERKHPSMRGIAESLSDKDMTDVAAYYAGKSSKKASAEPAKPSAEVQALLAKGNCTSCHGANFSKPINDAYPKIAGQHPDYLFVALKAYKSDGKSTVTGRNNAIMGGIAKQFTNNELKAMSKYIGSLSSDMEVTPESRFR
jgi:cytochrome c553